MTLQHLKFSTATDNHMNIWKSKVGNGLLWLQNWKIAEIILETSVPIQLLSLVSVYTGNCGNWETQRGILYSALLQHG